MQPVRPSPTRLVESGPDLSTVDDASAERIRRNLEFAQTLVPGFSASVDLLLALIEGDEDDELSRQVDWALVAAVLTCRLAAALEEYGEWLASDACLTEEPSDEDMEASKRVNDALTDAVTALDHFRGGVFADRLVPHLAAALRRDVGQGQ